MATERNVVVRVNLVAGGNVATAMRANADAARGLNTAVGAAGVGAVRPGVVAQAVAARGTAAPAIGDSGIGNAAIFKGLALATGAVAAASPEALQTLFGSAKLLAGELGLVLIPAVIQVSGFLQDLASKVRSLNEFTGGTLGRLVSFGAVVTLATVGIVKIGSGIAGLVLPVISVTRSMFGVTAAANAASAALGKVAAQGAVAGVAGSSAASGIKALPIVGTIVSAIAAGYELLKGRSVRPGQSFGENALGTVAGFATGGFNQLPQGASSPTAINLGFQGSSSDAASFARAVQSESIRDPLQQTQHEQQMRAMEAMIEELRRLHGTTLQNQPVPTYAANQ